VIDERWNNTLHRPIHAAGLFLNPGFSYACGFDFDAEIMDGFLLCVQKMVRSPEQRIEISKQIELYRMAGGTFGYDMAVNDRLIKMPGIFLFVTLFQLSNFIVSSNSIFFLCLFKILFVILL
jgi:hypothetical protein